LDDYKFIERLLKFGINPNILFNTGHTGIMIGVVQNNIFIVKLFLKYRGDPNIGNPIVQAIQNYNYDMVLMLIMIQLL